jgi:glucokinase
MASGTALTRYAAEIAAENPESALAQAAAAGKLLDGTVVSELAHAGDSAALSVMDKIGFYLGVGITNLVNIFNPEVFVVGGGISLAGDLIMKPAARVLAERGLRPNRDIVRLTTAKFGSDAGLIGAAVMAFTEVATI